MGPVRRVAMVALHTSPLERPGTGDAGGLNVYVAQTAARLAARGVEVDVLTRATPTGSGTQELAPGVSVHHLPAGPPDLAKGALPGHLDEFAAALDEHVRRTGYDVLHSHYWLSGEVVRRMREEHGVPLVHTMHTMARVKNLALAPGERPEPELRIEGEARVVAAADALVANTPDEARALVDLYGAAPGRVRVVLPGVDLDTFGPVEPGMEPAVQGAGRGRSPDRARARAAARAELGLDLDAAVFLFVGRIQPLKAPDVLVRAAAELVGRDPGLRERLVVAVLGGPSGSGLERPRALEELVAELGLGDVVRLGPPVPRAELARWYRAADLLAVPSHNESFGLVAVEALASGTPVVAARVGGLPLAVGDAGVLVDGHEPAVWADALGGTLDRLTDPAGRQALADRALAHARTLSWERTVDGLLDVYATVTGAGDPAAAPEPAQTQPTGRSRT